MRPKITADAMKMPQYFGTLQMKYLNIFQEFLSHGGALFSSTNP
jgi:hypothetical protein